jgi:hypothetical protein
MPANALSETLKRLDAIVTRRVRDEEAALRRADADLEIARRQRQKAHAEQRREIQATYAPAFQSFGTEVPQAIDDEHPMAFRKRLYNRLARRLPPGHELSQLRADDFGSQPIVFDNFEAMLLDAAKAEGERPSAANLPASGELISRVRVDEATGEKSINYYGVESFIKSLGRPGRRVAAIMDRRSGQQIWPPQVR